MPENNKEEIVPEETPLESTILEETKKKQAREAKDKIWKPVNDAVEAARRTYIGSFEPVKGEVTVPFEKAIEDLILVLQKIKTGEVELGGLEEEKVELPKPEV